MLSISFLNCTLRVKPVGVGGSTELKQARRIKCDNPIIRSTMPTVPSANIAGGVFSPTARPFALAATMPPPDNALAGKLAIAILSLLDVASALKALISVPASPVDHDERL